MNNITIKIIEPYLHVEDLLISEESPQECSLKFWTDYFDLNDVLDILDVIFFF